MDLWFAITLPASTMSVVLVYWSVAIRYTACVTEVKGAEVWSFSHHLHYCLIVEFKVVMKY